MKILHKLDGSHFPNSKKWLILIVGGILLISIYKIRSYYNPERMMKWGDATVGWIVSQELRTEYDDIHRYGEIKVNELFDIVKLDLDAETIRSIQDLKHCTNLKELNLNARNITNLSVLRRLNKVDKLVVSHGDMKTLNYLKDLKVSTLILKDFTLSSVEPLVENGNLSRLEVEDTYIEDAGSFQNLSGLTHLSLVHVSTDMPLVLCESNNYQEVCLSKVKIQNMDTLSHCTDLVSLKLESINLNDSMETGLPAGLKEVTVKDCGLTNLKMFLSLPNLTSLDVSDNVIEDISDLEKLSDLKALSLANNPIGDLSPIGCLKGRLKLNLSGIPLEGEILDVLSKMQFEEIAVSNCSLSDIGFLSGHDEIKRMDLSDNGIENIEILNIYRKGFSYLNLSGNPVCDLTPLTEWAPNIPSLYEDDPYFEGVELDVSGIQLGEMDAEKGIDVIENIILSRLTVRDCGLETAELARVQVRLQYLDISGNPIESIEPLEQLKFLTDVIARDTLITEKKLPRPHLTKLSTPPGTYGIAASWKSTGLEIFFFMDTGKKKWVRIVIE